MAAETTIARESRVNPVNAGSQRTMAFSRNGSVASGIIERTAVLDSIYGDTTSRNYLLNRQRLRNASRRMFTRINRERI